MTDHRERTSEVFLFRIKLFLENMCFFPYFASCLEYILYEKKKFLINAFLLSYRHRHSLNEWSCTTLFLPLFSLRKGWLKVLILTEKCLWVCPPVTSLVIAGFNLQFIEFTFSDWLTIHFSISWCATYNHYCECYFLILLCSKFKTFLLSKFSLA